MDRACVERDSPWLQHCEKKSRSRFGHIASATLRRYSCADAEGARTIKIEIIVHMLEENLIGRSRP